MEKPEIAALLSMNKANYPHAYKDMPKEDKRALLESWQHIFKDYPSELVQGAFMECLKVCRFPVTVADIFERLKTIRRATAKSTEELWQEFLQGATKVSSLSKGFGYTAPDKRNPEITQGFARRKEAKAVFEQLDGKLKSYVGSLKRLISFGEMSRGDLEQVIFPAFRRSMEAMEGRDEVLQHASPKMVAMLEGDVKQLGGGNLTDLEVIKNG